MIMFLRMAGDKMQYSELLFTKNSSQLLDTKIKGKLKVKNKRFFYQINTDTFVGDHVYEIILVINYLMKKYKQKIPITFELGCFEFSDKLVYVILESICYYMIKDLNYDIMIYFNAKHTIWSEGICYSPLKYLGDKTRYVRKFQKDICMRHYRRLIPNIQHQKKEYLSSLMQDISCFLKNNGMEEESCDQLSEVLVELVGNASEHGETDCLLDIDITRSRYFKVEENSDKQFYGVNAVVLNYSPTLFYEPLKNKLKDSKGLNERYCSVEKAKEFHFKHLQPYYNENDFYTISSFQHKISGNKKKNNTGGTGLTYLLKSLEEKSDTHYCYMLSGDRILFFEKDYMLSDSDRYVGFNKERNYFTQIPESMLLQTVRMFVSGVAYNLNYAIEKEW